MAEAASSGKVLLVGAGPGDPSLITLAGQRALRRADLVLYDNLAAPELLREASTDAERIYVGKRAGAHAMPQAEITALLVERAQAGQTVVRLKGGDPYIFGRGAEEAEALAAAGIRFEVVPGITAATAASLYGGIPLTDRRYASSLTFATGHAAADGAGEDLDWSALAALGGTQVFYMGVRTMERICQNLIEAGASPDRPAAVVQNASSPAQRSVEGTLGTIAEISAQNAMRSPALLVVGEVVKLRESIAWYEDLPLFGRRVAVTRATDRQDDMGLSLRALGADVVEIPTIAIERLELDGADRQRIADVGSYDCLILTSGAAVDTFFDHLYAGGKDSRALAGVRVATVGQATASRLERYGITADLLPPRYVAESLLETLQGAFELAGRRVLLPRSGRARAIIVEALREAGAIVDEIKIYQPAVATTSDERLADVLASEPDYITFTSSSTVENLIRILGEERFEGMRTQVHAASIGPVTTRTLRQHGIEPVVEADPHSVPGLIAAMEQHARDARGE